MTTAPATAQQPQQKVTWWGWVGAVILLFWAADNATLRPLLIGLLVVLILVNFTGAIKT